MKKRSQESVDGSCPYCGSFLNHSKGGKFGARQYICLDCNRSFRFGNYKKDEYISVNITKRNIQFPLSVQNLLEILELDHVSFEASKNQIVIAKSENGLLLRNKGRQQNTLVSQEELATYILRVEFNIPETEPAILEINPQNNTVMAIIKKGDIRKRASHERVNYNAQNFIGVRRNGTCYISALLQHMMNISAGDFLMIYEKAKKYYLYVAAEGDDKNDGFRVARAGSVGFANALTIGSTAFAVFLCDLYKQSTGSSFRVKCSNLVDVDNKKMVKLENID